MHYAAVAMERTVFFDWKLNIAPAYGKPLDGHLGENAGALPRRRIKIQHLIQVLEDFLANDVSPITDMKYNTFMN